MIPPAPQVERRTVKSQADVLIVTIEMPKATPLHVVASAEGVTVDEKDLGLANGPTVVWAAPDSDVNVTTAHALIGREGHGSVTCGVQAMATVSSSETKVSSGVGGPGAFIVARPMGLHSMPPEVTVAHDGVAYCKHGGTAQADQHGVAVVNYVEGNPAFAADPPSEARAGDRGIACVLHGGRTSAGREGLAVAWGDGCAKAGKGGVIVIFQPVPGLPGTLRAAVGRVKPAGDLEPNTYYRANASGDLEECPPGAC